jgi:hypothetical protein
MVSEWQSYALKHRFSRNGPRWEFPTSNLDERVGLLAASEAKLPCCPSCRSRHQGRPSDTLAPKAAPLTRQRNEFAPVDISGLQR